jgi:transcriptional regulator with GAF, ATPase, and Fis domain
MQVPNSHDERERLAALARYRVFNTALEPEIVELTRLAARVLDVPVSLLTLMKGERVAFYAGSGSALIETPKKQWFCSQVVATKAPLVVENGRMDARFANHPLVSGAPGFCFYAGYPLRSPTGLVLGALCVLDFRERLVESRYLEILEPLTKQVMALLELRLNRRLLAEELSEKDESRKTTNDVFRVPVSVYQRRNLVGESAVMKALHEQIERVAQGDWTVLIEGETGAGKELVAQAIHRASVRRDGRFIPVNCAGLTESILGSQLFGHIKGAFTGASADQIGFFEAADGGTILLDEIGDVSPQIQSALLRVLQEREVTRLGETQPRKVNARVIAATNQHLRQRVKEGRFRQDLYYRIRSARIRVAPLREHRDDVPQLVAAFLAEERVNVGQLVHDVSPEAIRVLMNYDWPGNVRELHGAVEYAVCRCRTGRIEVIDLPVECVEGRSLLSNAVEVVVGEERTRIVSALRRAGGSKVKAAKLLGIARATLYRRLTELEIDVDECVRY